MAFWYAFNEKHEDYTHADDSRYYDPALKEQLDRDAQEAGVKQKSVANNDELLSYAAYVYSTAVAIKAADYIGTTLGDLVKQTAKLDRQYMARRSSLIYPLWMNFLTVLNGAIASGRIKTPCVVILKR